MHSDNPYRVIRRSQWTATPWKNGGGVTHELARAAVDAAGLFEWRLSVARVAQDGPFSVFPGIDRQIALINGRGFRLQRESEVPLEIEVNRPGAGFAFHGDDPWTCTLLDGEVLDFNVMTRRDHARASLSLVTCGGGNGALQQLVRAPGATVGFLLLMDQAVQWSIEQQAQELMPLDGVLIDGPCTVDLGFVAATCLRVDIWQHVPAQGARP